MHKRIITVEDGCRIALPTELTSSLGIVPGMRLAITEGGGGFTLEPAPFAVRLAPFWRSQNG